TARLGRRTASARTATLVSAVGRPRLARRFPVISPLVSAVGRPHLALPRSPWPSDGLDSHDDFRSFYRSSLPSDGLDSHYILVRPSRWRSRARSMRRLTSVT